jgi:hypothetical protein
MVSVKIKWTIPDTDKWETSYTCHICRLDNTISFGQVRREEYIICRGCHQTVKLIDHLGGMQNLSDRMRKLGK